MFINLDHRNRKARPSHIHRKWQSSVDLWEIKHFKTSLVTITHTLAPVWTKWLAFCSCEEPSSSPIPLSHISIPKYICIYTLAWFCWRHLCILMPVQSDLEFRPVDLVGENTTWFQMQPEQFLAVSQNLKRFFFFLFVVAPWDLDTLTDCTWQSILPRTTICSDLWSTLILAYFSDTRVQILP